MKLIRFYFIVFFTKRCVPCNREFATRRLLSTHCQAKHNNKFECDYCGQVYTMKSAIADHLLRAHVNPDINPPQWECVVCHQRFQSQHLLKTHTYHKHREKIARHTCELCGQSFHMECFLKKHMETKHTDRAERLSEHFDCDLCGERYLSKHGLWNHRQVNKFYSQNALNFFTSFWI